jgi:uncharacterized protein (DUF1501 family)
MNYNEEIKIETNKLLTRRWFFKECGIGLGSVALASLLNGKSSAQSAIKNPLAPKQPHFKPKAKRVIYLFMAGGPSQFETFDYKPSLAKYNGKPVPQEFVKGLDYAFIRPDAGLYASELKFAQHGQSGTWVSEALPYTAQVVDDIAVVKSAQTDAINHAPAQIFMNTGSTQFGRPSVGAWVTYGLGSESQDLPAFVVMSSAGGLSGGSSNFGCGFLPTIYQGVSFRKSGDPILSLSNPRGVTPEMQRKSLDALKALNERHLELTGDPEIATRINSFEMAYRMQSSAPELMDLAKEPPGVLEMYGAVPGKPSFAASCLLARRLVERGVRFVQIHHEAWDQHGALVKDLKQNCLDCDQASAALVKDLKQRGLLDTTLVLWGGEFGRTPMMQAGDDGRDHHPNAYTMWLAGGGVKPGITLGETDELGFNVVKDRVHVHDLHTTLLHLLGFDHKRLTYRFQGRDFRLTDVHGELVPALLA